MQGMGINMQFSMQMRLGIGIDIENATETCYIVDSEDEEGTRRTIMTGFEGLAISLPFFKILVGEFHEIDVSLLDN